MNKDFSQEYEFAKISGTEILEVSVRNFGAPSIRELGLMAKEGWNYVWHYQWESAENGSTIRVVHGLNIGP